MIVHSNAALPSNMKSHIFYLNLYNNAFLEYNSIEYKLIRLISYMVQLKNSEKIDDS